MSRTPNASSLEAVRASPQVWAILTRAIDDGWGAPKAQAGQTMVLAWKALAAEACLALALRTGAWIVAEGGPKTARRLAALGAARHRRCLVIARGVGPCGAQCPLKKWSTGLGLGSPIVMRFLAAASPVA